jgi:hypothetical protein
LSNIGKTLITAKFLREHPPVFDEQRGVGKRSFIPVLADGGMMCSLLAGSGSQLAAGPRFQGSSAS